MKNATARFLVLFLVLISLLLTQAPASLQASSQPDTVPEPLAGSILPLPDSDGGSFSQAIQDQLKAILAGAVGEGGVPGAIAGVWLEGKGGWVQAAGVADLATEEPMRPEMRVRIASITKSFTAITLLRLVDQGKLGLDDPVANYLDFVPGGDQITVRMLLNHTSGIFDCGVDETFAKVLLSDPLRHWTPREMVELAFAHPPDFSPGSGYGYSNTNYLLLGMIIEKVSGESYESQVQKQVLEPLALRTTSFPSGPDLPAPFAHGYIDETLITGSGDPQREFTRVDMGWDWAAGALASTLEDLKVFARALAYGRLVSLGTYQDQTTWIPLFPDSDLYGDGLGVNNMNGLLGHNGGDPGFGSSMFCDPVRGLTVVVLLNQCPALVNSQALAMQMAKVVSPGLEFPDPSQPGQFFVPATESATTPAITRMLANPAVGSGQIAFVYTGDLWTAALDGSNPRRLTEGGWVQLNHDLVWRPAFSPDGKWIAFSGQQGGNVDVYLIPLQGGEPRRLTYHPGIDLVSGFTQDGRVLFASGQEASFQTAILRDFRLYTISTEGGWPESLPPRFAYNGSLSPDGRTLAYTPYNDAFEIWRDYRGGLVSTIHLFNLADWSADLLLQQPEVLLPQPESRC
ncbi:MAG: serine hydrolase, partial [Coprothermobacterota bacterium]|nr:serine hydrolase [Coprothermobacterota bacterium]